MDLDRIPAAVDEKICFNNLKRNRWLINDFVESSLLMEESITELNQKVLNGSTKLKRQMRLYYRKSLAKYSIETNPIDMPKLQVCSDEVVDNVISLVSDLVKSSSSIKNDVFEEDIDYGVALITSYSIIECIVMENPNDHN